MTNISDQTVYLGPLVRLELQSSINSEIIEAELTREKYLNLNVNLGSKVFIEPRKVRVFLDHKN